MKYLPSFLKICVGLLIILANLTACFLLTNSSRTPTATPNFVHKTESSTSVSVSDSISILPKADLADGAGIRQDYAKLPLYFIENQGQLDNPVQYYVQGRGTSLYFTTQGITICLTGNEKQMSYIKESVKLPFLRPAVFRQENRHRNTKQRWVIRLDFVNPNPRVNLKAKDRTPAVMSYFKGPRSQWKASVATYSSLVYEDLWPGIDLLYSGTANHLKYTFVVKPGADASQIKLLCQGAKSVTINAKGQLEVATPVNTIRDDRPFSYQEVNGRRVEVRTEYDLRAEEYGYAYGFSIGEYDESKVLMIDPAVLLYCGYIGGDGFDLSSFGGIAVDAFGNAYVVGDTDSNESTLPLTVGPDLSFNGGDQDIFVAKVDASGTALVYFGYIGGLGDEDGLDIAVDGEGNAYVFGDTDSDEASFPVRVGPDLTYNERFGGIDTFVAKINAEGTSLDYCGYIGGSGSDFSGGIAVDSTGSAYVFGDTASTESTFPVKAGPDLTYNGDTDGFIAKVNASGTHLDYCGYIGGANLDTASPGGIALDGDHNAYVYGGTSSDETTFPVRVGPDLTYNGGGDAFVAKVDATGMALDYCGYIGGSSLDEINGGDIAVDGEGNAYVIGDTDSDQSTFPVKVGPDLTYNGGIDIYIAKVNAQGTALDFCGYVGGSGAEFSGGIALDSLGAVYIMGETFSSESSFPVKLGPDLTFNGETDVFVAQINPQGTAFVYSGYIGGSNSEFACIGGIAVDSFGNAYVLGNTQSTRSSFPVRVGPDLKQNGDIDAFVAKVAYSQYFLLRFPTPVVKIKRGHKLDIKIKIERDEAFFDKITVVAPDTSSIGIKVLPSQPVSTFSHGVRLTLKVKQEASVGTQYLRFTARDESGNERFGTLVVNIR